MMQGYVLQSRICPERIHPDWNQLDEERRQEIRTELLLEYDRVCDAYSNMVLDIELAFEKSNIKPQSVKLKLEAYITAHCSKDTRTGLSEVPDDMCKIFSFMSQHTSWINYRLMSAVVEKLGNDEAKQLLRTYIQECLIPYIKRPLFEVPSRSFSTNTIDQSVQASLTIRDNIVLTIEEAIVIEQKLAHFLSLSSTQLAGYNVGSIELLFHIPKVVYDSASPDTPLRKYVQWDKASQSYIITADFTTILLYDVDNQDSHLSLLSKVIQYRQLQTEELLEEVRVIERKLSNEQEHYENKINQLMGQIQKYGVYEEERSSNKGQQEFSVSETGKQDLMLQLIASKDDGPEIKALKQDISELLKSLLQEKEQWQQDKRQLTEHLKDKFKMARAMQMEMESLSTIIHVRDSTIQLQSQEIASLNREILEKHEEREKTVPLNLENHEKYQLLQQTNQLLKETEKLEKSLQLEKGKAQTLAEESHQLKRTIQEKQSDIDTLAATVQEKDATIQSLTDQVQQSKEETASTYEALMTKEITRKNVSRREVHILVLGKAGVGKTSLANAILGKTKFKAVTGPSRAIEHFSQHYGNVSITVYDTHNLFDEGNMGKILDSIYLARPGYDFDVIIVCLKLHDRLDSENATVLRVASTMKPDVLSIIHVALTFSDYESPDVQNEDLISLWKEAITNFLSRELRVSTDIPVHNTSLLVHGHLGESKKMRKLLNNWLPRLLLNVMVKQRLFAFQTTLSIVASHPITGPALVVACGKDRDAPLCVDEWLGFLQRRYGKRLELIDILIDLENR